MQIAANIESFFLNILSIFDIIPIGKLKQHFIDLLGHYEESLNKNAQLTEEIQKLKNKIKELNGEHPTPNIKPDIKDKDPNPQYKQPKSKGKRGKRGKRNCKVKIDRTETINPNIENLPPDAIFKGYREVTVQDIVLKTDNIRFKLARYYSPSLRKYFDGKVPEAYACKEFGPNLRSFVIMLATQARVTENKIHSILTSIGTVISSGHVSNIIQDVPKSFVTEMKNAENIAKLKEDYVQSDATGIRILGTTYKIFCVCNKYFSRFVTTKSKSRFNVLKALIGDSERVYILDEGALVWLKSRIKNSHLLSVLKYNVSDNIYNEVEFFNLVKTLSEDPLSKIFLNYIKTAGLLSAYKLGYMGYMPSGLVSDDAHEFKDLMEYHQVCFIHEYRHYRMKEFFSDYGVSIADQFFKECWEFFDRLSEYQNNPTQKEKSALIEKFSDLCESTWNYHPIDSLRKNTIDRKEMLLAVLKDSAPNMPIHNNACEFDIREKVVKRKINYGHRSFEGCENANFWLGLYHTTRKNNVSFWEFLKDRFSLKNSLSQLSVIIEND